MKTKYEKSIRRFVEKVKHTWLDVGDTAKCRVTHYQEGVFGVPFISITVSTDGLGWVNSDIINGLINLTNATGFCVGTCNDAVWSDGVVVTLYLPEAPRRAPKKGKR